MLVTFFDKIICRYKIFHAKDLVHNAPHKVHVFIADLHKDAAAFAEQLAGKQQAVAHVAEIGMDAQLPCVAEGLDAFGLAGEVLVFVLHAALSYEGLKVAAVFDAVGRVHIKALHPARHVLFLQKRIHNEKRVAGNEAVAPVMLVFVKLDGLAQGALALLRKKQVALPLLVRLVLYGGNDRVRVDALVHVQGAGGDFKRRVLGLARPLQLRVQVRVISVALLLPGIGVGSGGHKACRRVVYALFVLMFVAVDEFFHLLEVALTEPCKSSAESAAA